MTKSTDSSTATETFGPGEKTYDELIEASKKEIARQQQSMKALRRERDARIKVIHDAYYASGGFTARWDDNDSKNDNLVKQWNDGLAALDRYDAERGYKVDTIIGPERYIECPPGYVVTPDGGLEEAPVEPIEPVTFKKALESLINEYSRENMSNTPDYVLAQYLSRALDAAEDLIMDREVYYNVHMEPGKTWVESGEYEEEQYAPEYEDAEKVPPNTHNPETGEQLTFDTPPGYNDIVMVDEGKLGTEAYNKRIKEYDEGLESLKKDPFSDGA